MLFNPCTKLPCWGKWSCSGKKHLLSIKLLTKQFEGVIQCYFSCNNKAIWRCYQFPLLPFPIFFSECHPQLRRKTIHEILVTVTANLVCAFYTPSAGFNFKDNYSFCLLKGVSFRDRQKQLGAWMWNSKRGELLRTLSVISDCSQKTFLTCQVLHSHALLACQ